jgi:hypothetical protein
MEIVTALLGALVGGGLAYLASGSLQASEQKRLSAIEAKRLWVEAARDTTTADGTKQLQLAAIHALAAGDRKLYDLFMRALELIREEDDHHREYQIIRRRLEAHDICLYPETEALESSAAREAAFQAGCANRSWMHILSVLVPERLDPLLTPQPPLQQAWAFISKLMPTPVRRPR